MSRGRARRLGAAALVVLAVAVAVGPVLDFDLFWHLAVGRWIVLHRALPTVDPLALGHRPWVPYSWLFELWMLALHHSAGWLGIEIYRILAALGVLAALRWTLGQVPRGPLSPGALTAIAWVGMVEDLSERSWMVTLLGTLLSLGVALRAGRGRTRGAWLLIPLYVVWANVHVQFVYGLAVLGWGVLIAARTARLRLALVAFACALATLAGPLGIGIWRVAWGYARNHDGLQLLQELTPPVFDSPWQKLSLLLQLAAVAAVIVGLRNPRRRRDALKLAPLLAFALVSFARLRRELWLADAVSAVTLSQLVRSQALRSLERRIARPLLAGALLAVALAALLLALPTGTPAALKQAIAESYPEGAAREIALHPEWNGPLYHDINWAGFIAWALPGREILIDGRTNLHSDQRLHRNTDCWRGRGADPELLRAGLIIANPMWPLTATLEHEPDLRRVYADATAEVFLRQPIPAATSSHPTP